MSEQPNREPALVLYHRGCMDGAGAAAAALLALGPQTEFVGVQYGEPPPEPSRLHFRDVYVLDFSYPRAVLLEMAGAGARLVVLDHHKTAAADLHGIEHPNLRVQFDMERSGAVLAWHWFHAGEPPILLQYIQDRDLWRWQMPKSREVSAALQARGYALDVPALARVIHECEEHPGIDLSELFCEGAAVLRAQAQQVAQLKRLAEDCLLDIDRAVYAGRVVNAPLLQSEVAGELAEETAGVGAAWWWDGRARHYVVSLRSRGDLDVSEIAKHFGGGGHKNAAGFVCDELPWRGAK